MRGLSSLGEPREGGEPSLEVRQLLSEEVEFQIGCEGQKKDSVMAREAKGQGLCQGPWGLWDGGDWRRGRVNSWCRRHLGSVEGRLEGAKKLGGGDSTDGREQN